VKTGLYSKIRNPIYIFGGLGYDLFMALCNWPALGLVFVLYSHQIPGVKKEERVLEQAFGEEYRGKKRAPGFEKPHGERQAADGPLFAFAQQVAEPMAPSLIPTGTRSWAKRRGGNALASRLEKSLCLVFNALDGFLILGVAISFSFASPVFFALSVPLRA
jgi:hypothetical protein